MFTFTDKKVGSLLTDEKCFNDLYDLYKNRNFTNKLVLVLEDQIAYELPLKMISVNGLLHVLRDVYIFLKKRYPMIIDQEKP